VRQIFMTDADIEPDEKQGILKDIIWQIRVIIDMLKNYVEFLTNPKQSFQVQICGCL
jgi:hypothetical protein